MWLKGSPFESVQFHRNCHLKGGGGDGQIKVYPSTPQNKGGGGGVQNVLAKLKEGQKVLKQF